LERRRIAMSSVDMFVFPSPILAARQRSLLSLWRSNVVETVHKMRYALFYLYRLPWLPWIPVSNAVGIWYGLRYSVATHAPPCVTYLCTAPCHKVWLWYLQRTYSMRLYVTARSSFSVQQQTSHETMRTKGQIMKRFFCGLSDPNCVAYRHGPGFKSRHLPVISL